MSETDIVPCKCKAEISHKSNVVYAWDKSKKVSVGNVEHAWNTSNKLDLQISAEEALKL